MAVPTLTLGAIHVLGLAGLGILLGEGMVRTFPVLSRLSVPRAIIGGLLLACVALVLRDRVANFVFDEALRTLFMVTFFTTIGLGASFRFLKIGGGKVVIFLIAAIVGLIAQIAFGAAAASGLGEPAVLGLIPGAVALTGGPATAGAFGGDLERPAWWGLERLASRPPCSAS